MSRPVSTSSSGQVSVAIVEHEVARNPLHWLITYEAANDGDCDAWLIDDDFLVLRRDGDRIAISYAREPMQPGVHVFGYFAPRVVRMRPGRREQRSVEISWPCRLSDIWNPQREVSIPPGEYRLSVTIGWAPSEEPDSPGLRDSAESAVLKWQRKAESEAVTMVQPE